MSIGWNIFMFTNPFKIWIIYYYIALDWSTRV